MHLVLSAVAKLDDLIEEVVILVVDLVCPRSKRRQSARWNKNKRAWTDIVPMVSVRVEMSSSKGVEFFQPGLLSSC